jgi:peptidyl-prolyl cis-trans isomerase D
MLLQSIRTRAGGVIIKVLFALLILSFVGWGIFTRSPFSQDTGSPDAIVASVGDREIRADQFQAALKPAVERLRAQFGGTLDAAQLKQLGIPDAVLEQLIDQSLLDQEDTHLRLDLSDDVIRSAITSNPAFIGPDGRFSHNQLSQILSVYRMTEEGLIAKLRAEIPRGDLLQALTAGVRIPTPVIDTIYRYRSETRVADVVAIPLSTATGVGTPSDDDLKKFYEAHADLFKAEEYRSFTLASLGIADLASEITVSDDDLKAAYKQRKDDLAIPEQRQLQQILAASEDKAKAVEAALSAGQDFAKVATTIAGQDPQTIDLGLVKASDLPKALADAAFDLPLNKPSEPIKDSFGWHILMVTKIEPPKTPSFDEAKQQLKDELTQEAEADRLDRIANKIDDALAGGTSLADAAAKFHLKVTTIAATDVGGRDPGGKPVAIAVSPKDVLKLAFDTGENETSRVTATEDGAIFIVHVDKVTPPQTKPIAEVKDQIVTAWTAERKKEAVTKQADALAAAVAAGTPLAKAAADQKLTVATPAPLTRRPQPGSAVPGPLVAKLFSAKVGETVVASDAAGAYVGQLKEIKTSDTTPADLAKGLQTELGNAARYDIVGELTGALKQRYKVTIHRDVMDKLF